MIDMTWVAYTVAGSILGLLVVMLAAVLARQARLSAALAEHAERAEQQLTRIVAEQKRQHTLLQQFGSQLAELATRQDTMAHQNPAPRGYDQAIRMARTGSSAAQLVTACGMTSSEAELLVHLHGPKAA